MGGGGSWYKLCRAMYDVAPKLSSIMAENGMPENEYEMDAIRSSIEENLSGKVYLVLDDYHEMEDKLFSRFIEYMSFNFIELLQIIIISRTYPEMNYRELWRRGFAVIIDKSILALECEEIGEFFQNNDVYINKEQMQEVYEYTEGWFSAVYLILFDYRQNNQIRKIGSINSLVYDFIFNAISNESQIILMKMSVFSFFTIDQAVYVTGMESCRYLLPLLIENIGFIKYDSVTGYYHLNSVLGLVVSAEREKRHIDTNEIYEKGAEWYEQIGRNDYAVICYNNANNKEKILEILDKHNTMYVYRQIPHVLHSFFENITYEEAWNHPIGYIPYIYQCVADGLPKGKILLKKAKAYYKDKPHEKRNEVMAALCVVEWNLKFNDINEMTKLAKEAYEYLDGGQSEIFQSDMVMTYGTPEFIVLFYGKLGTLRDVVKVGSEFTSYYLPVIRGYNGDWNQFFEAEYAMITGDIERANSLAKIVSEKSKIRNQICVSISAYFIRLRYSIQKGNLVNYQVLLKELEEITKNNTSIVIQQEKEIMLGFLNGSIGNIDEIPLWLKEFDLENCNKYLRATRCGCITYGLVLIYKKEWSALLALAEELIIPYDKTKHAISIIYSGIYKSVALYNMGDLSGSYDTLYEILKKTKLDGARICFIEMVEHIEPILLEIMKREKSIYLEDLYGLAMERKKGYMAFRSQAGDNATNKSCLLTERQLQIMKLVKLGMKNSEIAKDMNVAVVTIEKNFTAIYKKLNVSNRVQALEKLYSEGVF